MKRVNLDLVTADGVMDTILVIPDIRPLCPAVILFMDIFGVREELVAMATRFAVAGYATYLPNLFYRRTPSVFPVANGQGDQVDPRAREAGEKTTLDMTASDMAAVMDHARADERIDGSKFGTIGYCMGARHALATAARYPETVRASASIHGGKLVDRTGGQSAADLILEFPGELYFAFAESDPSCPPDDQAVIEQHLAGRLAPGSSERFAAPHGWSFEDRWCFDRPSADRVWERAFDLFDRTL